MEKSSYRKKAEVIEECITEAKRFIEKAQKAKEKLLFHDGNGIYGPYQIHEFAAAKRAALDLKKQLTEITHKIIN